MDPDHGFEEELVRCLPRLRAKGANRHCPLERGAYFRLAGSGNEGQDQLDITCVESLAGGSYDGAVQRVAMRGHVVPPSRATG
jgi:hypothetical protein